MDVDINAPSLTYDGAKALAMHTDPAVRATLAARTDVPPEILYYLTQDGDVTVRRAAAQNTTLPRQADLHLARDDDPGVRAGLALKIAKVSPGLDPDAQDKISKATRETLELLARDEMTRVRQVLAEVLKDVADAPPDVIRTLAMDTEIDVAGPVLQFSPVLTDEDLIEIIKKGPAQGGLGAIARRDGVSENLADALVASDDDQAIADLLANDSAQIREETLDDLVNRAEEHELWHAPLVQRPKLPPRAASKLAQFVADNLLQSLSTRPDLDPETLEAVGEMVRHRISQSAMAEEHVDSPAGAPEYLRVPPPLSVAKRLYLSGKLDERVLNRALMSSDYPFVLAGLTVRAEVSLSLAVKVFTAQTAKGILAICRKADVSPEFAVLVQQRLGRVPPTQILAPSRSGVYPVADSELRWQLEFFANISEREAG